MGGISLAEGNSIDDVDDNDVMNSSSSDKDDDFTTDTERDDRLGKSFDCWCDDVVANKSVIIIWGSTDKQERVLTTMMEKADDVDGSKKRNVVAANQYVK